MDPRHLQHLVVQHLTRVPAVWLFGCLASCLAAWLPGWLAPGWLTGCLAAWLSAWLARSLAGWLVGWLALGIVNISLVFLAYLNMCTQNCYKTIGFY